MENEEEVKDEMLDIDPTMRPVALQYGREMFALVMNAGFATHAASILNTLVQKHRSQHGAKAVAVLADCFNQTSNALCAAKGWDAGMLAQCDRDIQLAFRAKIEVVPANAILLNS